ncbi:MAG: hypothetical protein DCO96_10190 [Fluviicola sp. XM-24bin1]|nr:MAG: hypothetical protein DCO96_10190 [Fluviicola sp. XM-24bin1]
MVKHRDISVFAAIMALYFLVRWVLIFGSTGVLRWYLTDLLFVPAMCLFGLILIRRLKNDREILIPWYSVLLQVLLVSLYFEWYLPNQNVQYTSDPLDILMYFAGGIAFLLFQRRL